MNEKEYFLHFQVRLNQDDRFDKMWIEIMEMSSKAGNLCMEVKKTSFNYLNFPDFLTDVQNTTNQVMQSFKELSLVERTPEKIQQKSD